MKQLRFMLRRKTFMLVFFFLMILVFINYFHNVFTYAGRDVIRMYHPMKLLTLSRESDMGNILLQVWPLLLVLPCAFSYLEDRNSGMELFQTIRCGKKNYYFKKVLAVFLTTWLVFSLPFLLEAALNILAFPIHGPGDLATNANVYEPKYIESARNYLFAELYGSYPYLYAVFGILLFGVCSGILASFLTALSYLPFIKFRIFLFLPVYLVVEIFHNMSHLTETPIAIEYDAYLFLYDSTENKSETAYLLFLLAVVILTIGFTWWKSRRDSRNL